MIFAKGALDAAAKIHIELIQNVFRLPMRFFDVTPIGRIIGRFSNDINGIDNYIPPTLQMIFRNVVVVGNACYFGDQMPSAG